MIPMTGHVSMPLWAGLALALLSSHTPVAAQEHGKEAAAAAIAEYEKYARDRNENVRIAAVADLGVVDHLDVTRVLLAALQDPSEAVRDAAIVGLGQQRNKAGVSEMTQKMWRDRNRDLRIALIKAFKASVPETAWSAVQDLVEDKDWEIRANACELISRYPNREEEGLGAILPLTKDREALVRLAAMDALVLLQNPRSKDAAVEGLKDKDWRVRAASIKVCRHFRWKAGVQPLIDLLRDEEGRLQDDAAQALRDICDRDSAGDHAAWQEWWDRVSDGFKIPTLAEIAERRRKESIREAGYDPPRKGDYPPYHGIKTRSRRILFVLDTSASMAELVTLDESDRASLVAFEERYGQERIKINIAREELITMVAGLKSYAKFNIVTFNSKTDPWQKQLVPASAGNKNKAIKWLARLTPESIAPLGGRGKITATALEGQTNTFEAINACFGLFKGDEVDKKTFVTDADTVFFLSDGNPSTGRLTQPQTLLDYVATVNKRAKMVIHAISFGNSNKILMEGLALRNNGQFVMIGR